LPVVKSVLIKSDSVSLTVEYALRQFSAQHG